MFPYDPGTLILCVIFLMQIAGVGGYFVARHKYKKREEEAAIRGSELREMIQQAVDEALASSDRGRGAELAARKEKLLPAQEEALPAS